MSQQSHFVVQVKNISIGRGSRLTPDERSKLIADQNLLRTAPGCAAFAARYFTFLDNDAKGKVKAKEQADRFAAKWGAKFGIDLQVYEGFFL